MPSSGYCDVYIQFDEFSNVTGDADVYAEFTLATVPQKDSDGKLMFDMRLIEPAVDYQITASLKIGLSIRVKIPILSFETTFTVPDQATFDLATLVT